MERLVARRVIAEKYRLDRPLAAGGMGSVWAAWNTQLDVPVAIKFMAPPLAASPELVARFEREARAAAQIRSPHVVQIFEHGIDGALPFIVMELLEGEDLGTRMRREGRLSLEATARIVAGVCKALRKAHAMGIVHRDLKPANVFLAQSGDDDEEEVVKVLDFGVVKSLAEAVDSGVTKTGELIGTPAYMSPEQARTTKKVDHRSDLWSLGIIAYRALTASLPFPKDEGLDRLMRICSEPIPPPSTLQPDLGPEIDELFARALAIDPDLRFQTAREMAEAMRALAGVPASSRSGSRGSIADAGPPSSTMYTAHAYVYTSAPEAERSGATDAQQPSSPSFRVQVKAAPRGDRRLLPQEAPLFPFDPAMRPTAAAPGAGNTPTRVSNADLPGPARAPSTRPPVSIVTGALADASGPLPPLSGEAALDTLSNAGISKSQGTAGRILLAPSRFALGAGVSLLLVLSGVVFLLAGPSGEPRTPAASAAPQTILFSTAAVPGASAPTAPVTVASAAPVNAPAAPTTSASAAPASTPEPPASAPVPEPTPKRTTTPAAAPSIKASSPRPWTPRKEGGIGRRPTY